MIGKLIKALKGEKVSNDTRPIRKTIQPYDYTRGGETVSVQKHTRTYREGDEDEPKSRKKKPQTTLVDDRAKADRATVRHQNATIRRLTTTVDNYYAENLRLREELSKCKDGSVSLSKFSQIEAELAKYKKLYEAERSKTESLKAEADRMKDGFSRIKKTIPSVQAESARSGESARWDKSNAGKQILVDSNGYALFRMGYDRLVWDGPGTYAAKRLRGSPTIFYKVTSTGIPSGNPIVVEFKTNPIDQ